MITINTYHTPQTLRRLITDHIDSGKLFLVDETARGVGKTQALFLVASEFSIPIITHSYENADLLNNFYSCKLFFSYRMSSEYIRGTKLMCKNGFLMDAGVPLEFIDRARKEANVKLRTGFFEKYPYFM